MARSTMAEMIALMRPRINADTADYTIGTASFWDADQIQAVLEQHRNDMWRVVISPIETYNSGGTVTYLEYPLPETYFETTDAGTAVFFIEAGDNTKIGTANYSVDYQRGWVTFTADQKGSAYWLTGRAYDLDGAAATIWRHKAAKFAEAIDFTTDNMSVKRGLLVQNAMTMAKQYEQKSKRGAFQVTMVYRDDINSAALK